MKKKWMMAGLVLMCLAYLVFYLSGIPSVPFHPDESTQIFMSSDVDILFHSPTQFITPASQMDTIRNHYRLIDSPLTRLQIGIARLVFNKPAQPSDWDWSATWMENIEKEALPPADILFLSRLFVSLLFPFSLVAFYLANRRVFPGTLSLLSVLLLGFNSLILLHTRRAMAEGLLLGLSLLILWRILLPWSVRNTVILGVLMGLALQAKQLALPLILGCSVIILIESYQHSQFRGLAISFSIITTSIILITYVFNPVMWKDPIQTGIKMGIERTQFSSSQAVEYQDINAPIGLPTFPSRIVAVISQTFFAPPVYEDVGNYTVDLKAAIKQYELNPLNTIASGWVIGSVCFILSIFGIISMLFRFSKERTENTRPWQKILFLNLLIIGFDIAFIPIAFQRYYLLLIPFVMLWVIASIHILITSIKKVPAR